jgi:serine/threonine-protein kinase
MAASQQIAALNLAPDSVFREHYRIRALLGRGGMGAVYLAQDLATEKEVALKVPITRSSDQVASFAREVEIHSRLKSPYIAAVFGSCTDPSDGPLYLALEYLSGRSLAEVIGSSTLPPLATRITWLTQVAYALEHLHTQGVIHRDITPGNILITSEQQGSGIKLLDFGAALQLAQQRSSDDSGAIGTLYYMSPEQHRGSQLDVRSDIYSCGVLAYELLTGEKAFELERQYEEFLEAHHLKLRHLAGRIPSVREKNQKVSGFLSTVVQVCMQKKKQYRYDTASEVARRLERALQIEVDTSLWGQIRRVFA